ncbi:MAG: beta-N-acetylhexosaminidase [Rhodospirillales bacterium]|nr:MAG: beta-N-acetylhexosaminidase [Rhodospirillales bacterium]
MGGRPPRAIVFGCGGPALTVAERRFFAGADPLGFILFARNCLDPQQVRALVQELRAAVGRDAAPVLIDQEGGRVARLRPPHWRVAPAASRFSDLARGDAAAGQEAAWLNARLLADELAALGITVDCAPVLDVPQPGGHPVIGDRAAGDTAERAATLGRAWCEGLLAGGVLPVIKHIPGHGRATVDSHAALPVVDADRPSLESVDWVPFRALAAMPWAMTAHVVYTALDPEAPATTSTKVIDGVIRRAIGFDGVLVSDDLCMGALGGSVGERVGAALAAGCDIVLHCNGVLAEMEAAAAACPGLTPAARYRLERAEAMREPSQPFDRAAALARLDELLAALPEPRSVTTQQPA